MTLIHSEFDSYKNNRPLCPKEAGDFIYGGDPVDLRPPESALYCPIRKDQEVRRHVTWGLSDDLSWRYLDILLDILAV